MENKVLLSVVMIVKNESSCLADCLELVKKADEIIIVDTGSTDNTCNIARKYTNKVFENEYKWEDSFCKARNFAKSKATGKWILSIDADEVLEFNGIAKIKDAIKIAEQKKCQTIDVIMVANGSGNEFNFPRVFRNCKEIFWKGDIHNYLNVVEKNSTDIRILYKYSATHANDPDRALRILTKVIKEKPNSVREVFYLAREYWYRKDWITASYWYQDYLKRAYWPPEWSEAWVMLARCYWNLGKINEAKDACLQAIKINANYKEALLLMANLSGPGNKKAWKNYAQYANNNNVLNIRKTI